MTLAEAHKTERKYKLPEEDTYYRLDNWRYVELRKALRDDWEVEPEKTIECCGRFGLRGVTLWPELTKEQQKIFAGKRCRITVEGL